MVWTHRGDEPAVCPACGAELGARRTVDGEFLARGDFAAPRSATVGTPEAGDDAAVVRFWTREDLVADPPLLRASGVEQVLAAMDRTNGYKLFRRGVRGWSMFDVLPEKTERFVRAAVPENELVAEMDAYADEVGFPIVGREVGQFLRVIARIADAERVFEFGSGFGYSAYWFAGALPDDGEVVLTEFDGDNLDTAREFLGRADLAGKATFEQGDAMETIERYDGPFDVVLIDHRKENYPDALDAVREKVHDGGVIVADNAMVAGTLDTDAILESIEGGDPEMDDSTRGIATYLETVRDDPAFETSIVPLGQAIAVSYKLPSS